MRGFRRGVVLGILAAAGCMRVPTWDWDSEADAAEARAFCERWCALEGKTDPASERARAMLALSGLSGGMKHRLPCVTGEALRTQGMKAAEKATAAAPQDPALWSALSRLRTLSGDDAGALEAACRAAELAPSDAGMLELCGNAQLRCGDGRAAVQRYQQAIAASVDREQQFDLIRKIEQVSPRPSEDLAAVPVEVLEQYRMQQRGP